MRKDRIHEHQIIELLITPRAALAGLLASGTIDLEELRSLQCCCVLAAQAENVTGIKAPDSTILEGLIQQIENGLAVIEERIERAQKWLDEYADYLRRIRMSDFRKAVRVTMELIRKP